MFNPKRIRWATKSITCMAASEQCFSLQVKIVKPGEEDNQGVGYFDDGTMTMIEGSRPRVDHRMSVTSVLQTSALWLNFRRFQEVAEKSVS